MSSNISSRLKKLKEINYLKKLDNTDTDYYYVDCCYNNVVFNVFRLKYL